jgi:hypothetical protein
VKLWRSRGGTGIVLTVLSGYLRNGDYENIIKFRPDVPSLCVHIYLSQKVNYEETVVDLVSDTNFCMRFSVKTNSGVHPASCAVDIEESIRGVKSLKHEAEYTVQCLGLTSPVFMHGASVQVQFILATCVQAYSEDYYRKGSSVGRR